MQILLYASKTEILSEISLKNTISPINWLYVINTKRNNNADFDKITLICYKHDNRFRDWSVRYVSECHFFKW